jgi:hypothetical protein
MESPRGLSTLSFDGPGRARLEGVTKQLATIVAALALCLAGCGGLPPNGDPVRILTAPRPECFVADVAGRLVVDSTDGTAIVGDGHENMLVGGPVPVTVAWPPGFTARRSGAEVEVLDPRGNVVGTTGRSYTFLGGYVAAGGSSGLVWPELTKTVLLSCGNLEPEAAPTASPTQDQIRKAAARAYADAVIPTNRARSDVSQRYENKVSLKDNKTSCWKLAAVERDFIVALQGIRYPDDAAADARALVRDEAAQEAALRTCAKAPNFSALNRAIDLANKARDRAHEASNLVRLDLGLDPRPS